MPQHPKRIQNPDQPFIYVGDKDLRRLQKKAWDAGWWPVRKKSGVLWFAPDQKSQVLLHGTTSDSHAVANAMSRFRRAGLHV